MVGHASKALFWTAVFIKGLCMLMYTFTIKLNHSFCSRFCIPVATAEGFSNSQLCQANHYQMTVIKVLLNTRGGVTSIGG